MDKRSDSVEDEKSHYPSPADFDVYLPWASIQLQIPYTIVITRVEQDEYISPSFSERGKGRKATSKPKEEIIDQDSDMARSGSNSGRTVDAPKPDHVYIYTIYDSNDALVQLKFLNNLLIPREVMKLMSLILPFQKRLTSVYINSGLLKDSLYELCKGVNQSTITEMILDNSVIPEANYYLFLDHQSPLKYLSLARCQVNDEVVKTLSIRLVPPFSASETLSILNLTSNRITDVGAQYLGEVLRVNRKLSYLNLAGNMITDVGAESILDSLGKFVLKDEEVAQSKARYMSYLRLKNEMVNKALLELRTGDFDRRSAKRKSIKPVAVTQKKSKGLEKEVSVNLPSMYNSMDVAWIDKAEAAVEAQLGTFQDAFRLENISTKNGTVYCLGNNALCYLNLAYNSLSYFSVKKLYNIVSLQERMHRKPKGLVNVCIEGNNIPVCCRELTEIDLIIDTGLTTSRKLSTISKKKMTAKMK
ncbi:uncharacterized protein LOC142984001 [Anticarsia gemmatalis]|uniref:uncharacterized protein LOC142984001 n=1 Tax=Anticarsia gemmatalis TaxID=129554 RepID=UPI003F7596A3